VTPPTGLPDPVAGVNFNVVPISGTVLVNGAVLPTGQQIPFGAIIDATNGIVSITTIGPTGLVQKAFFYGGSSSSPRPTASTLVLRRRLQRLHHGVAKKKSEASNGRPGAAATAKPSRKVVRSLWGAGRQVPTGPLQVGDRAGRSGTRQTAATDLPGQRGRVTVLTPSRKPDRPRGTASSSAGRG
jgi:hypothetical protein